MSATGHFGNEELRSTVSGDESTRLRWQKHEARRRKTKISDFIVGNLPGKELTEAFVCMV
jgi:hypothetical protein